MTETNRGHDRLSADDAAEYIGVEYQTLAAWRSNKRHVIPYIKVGSKVFYRRSDLDTWLESRRVVGASGPSSSATFACDQIEFSKGSLRR
jgi:excisionase family DNA binding protein